MSTSRPLKPAAIVGADSTTPFTIIAIWRFTYASLSLLAKSSSANRTSTNQVAVDGIGSGLGGEGVAIDEERGAEA